MEKEKDAGRTESGTKEETPVKGEQDTLTKEITGDQPKTEDVHTTVMIAVSQCSKGYPNPSISSRHAFEWVSKNLIKPCCKKQYKLLILHVQVIDEDGLEELDSVYASPSDFQHSRHKERVKGRALIQTFVKQCHDAQIECEGWIKKGDPKDVICQEVKKKKPRLTSLGLSWPWNPAKCNESVRSQIGTYLIGKSGVTITLPFRERTGCSLLE